MKNSSPAQIVVQGFSKDFKEKFNMGPNLYSMEAIISDSIAEDMAEYTRNRLCGREFKSKLALVKAIGRNIVKDETEYIKELVKLKNWTSASRHLKDLLEKGRINIQEFKVIDTEYIQPLEVELRKKNEQRESAKQDSVGAGKAEEEKKTASKPKGNPKKATSKKSVSK